MRRAYWTDTTRIEAGAPSPVRGRELPVTVYYPTDAAVSEALPPYYRDSEAFVGVLPPEVYARVRALRLPVVADAPVGTSRPWPLLVFIHGWKERSDAYSLLLMELASRGRIVVGIDQPYQGRVVLSGGAVTEAREDHFADPMEMISFYGADVSAVLERTLAHPDFGPAIDRGRITAVGHSNGALAALTAVRDDDRITDVVSLNGWDAVFDDVFSPRVPTLLLRANSDAAPSPEFLARHPDFLDVASPEMSHGTVMDTGWTTPTSASSRDEGIRAIRSVADLLDSYLASPSAVDRVRAIERTVGRAASIRGGPGGHP